MSLFTSKKEKQLWLWVLAVMAAIFASLFIGTKWPELLRSSGLDAGFFLLGMLLVFISVLIHGFFVRSKKIEVLTILVIVTAYLMFFFRMTLAERSHLIEYSLLAILVHRALLERAKQDQRIKWITSIAFFSTFFISLIDEGIQLFLPKRVFDINDILFNAIAIFFAIIVREIILWIRKLLRKQKRKN